MKKNNDYFNVLKLISKTNSPKIFFDMLEDKRMTIKLIKVLESINQNFNLCEVCFYICENNICYFCSEKERNTKILCVVSSLYDAYKIYNSDYDGLIHVISNIKSTDNKNNKSINLLTSRSKNVDEVILAMSLTFEGEIISNYLKSKLHSNVKKVSRIAQGIPFGGSLNYADYETLSSALLNRKKIK